MIEPVVTASRPPAETPARSIPPEYAVAAAFWERSRQGMAGLRYPDFPPCPAC